ncbi:hypothetical protein [Bosea sp. MMO-172]|uniref:hypothetical protein n=1 Tax=Bosea sp. MMO-172 TaxID=3127885 RepID=UPI003019EED5
MTVIVMIFVSSVLVVFLGTTASSRACPGIHRRAPELYDGSRIGAASPLVRDDAVVPRKITGLEQPDIEKAPRGSHRAALETLSASA